jgi:23S rRNA pseudouridine1911/1915/1917 synthase
VISEVLPEALEGERLDRVVALLTGASRAAAKALVEDGHVTHNGATATAGRARVATGDRVEIDTVPAVGDPQGSLPTAEPEVAFEVVHEDRHVVVIDKPAGLVVHPGAGRTSGTLVNALLGQVKDLSGIGGVLRPGIVHRLDRGTSGLLVIAKDDATHRDLARQFASRRVEKEYLALVLGVPPRAKGEIALPIGRDPVHRKRMSVRAPKGRAALTRYSVVEALDGAALLRVRLHTGRTHQIRVHLASIGHPVAGDETYGGRREPPSRRASSREALRSLRRAALHAARLAFEHPATRERVCFESPLPADISEVIESLRN